MTTRVTVIYRAQLKQAAGVASEEVGMAATPTLRDLCVDLARRHGHSVRSLLLDGQGRVRPSLLIFVGPERVGGEHALRDGDQVTLLAPMAGG